MTTIAIICTITFFMFEIVINPLTRELARERENERKNN